MEEIVIEVENNKNENIEEKTNQKKKSNRLCNDKQRKKKRQKEKKEKDNHQTSRKKKILRIVLIVLAVLVLICGACIGAYIYKADGDITAAALNMAADVLGEEEPIFILVLGLSEDISAALTDTIILAGYNPDSQKAFMLSIPRDTFVGTGEAWASGYDKINAAYQKGPEKTIEVVEKLTGIQIDYYVLVKNTALPAIVSAIGEVEFDVPIDMDYDDPTQDLHIHLEAGVQMIDGNEAEQLLRFRHNNDGSSYPMEYGDNDYGRMRTQREFIKAVASQLVSGSNVSKLKEIGTAVFNNLTTNMPLSKMLGYAPTALKLDMNGIRMEQLPGASSKINNLWFYKHDSTETFNLVNELLTEIALDEKELEKHYEPTKKVKNTSTSSKNTTKNQNTTSSKNTTKIEETEKDVHTHSYTSKVATNATCTSDGEEVYTCNCGKTYTQKLPATGHTTRKTETISGTTKTITESCTNTGCTYTKTSKEEIKTSGSTTDDTNKSEQKPSKVENQISNNTTTKEPEENKNESQGETIKPPVVDDNKQEQENNQNNNTNNNQEQQPEPQPPQTETGGDTSIDDTETSPDTSVDVGKGEDTTSNDASVE